MPLIKSMRSEPPMRAPGTKTLLAHIGKGVYAGVVLVTPEIAANWLPNEEVWRSRNAKRVRDYRTQMTNGQWELDGNTIKFNKDEELIDGQHRCSACILSNSDFLTVVIRGNIKQHAMADTGLSRRLSDWLKLKEVSNAAEMASLLRLFRIWTIDGNVGTYHKTKAADSASNEDLMELLEENPGLQSSLAFGRRIAGAIKGYLPATWIANLHYVISLKVNDSEMPTGFFEGLLNTSKLETTDPLFQLWKFLGNRYDESKRGHGSSKDIVTYHAVVIKAWNAWIQGTEIKQLRFKRFGTPIPEPFPEILTG